MKTKFILIATLLFILFFIEGCIQQGVVGGNIDNPNAIAITIDAPSEVNVGDEFTVDIKIKPNTNLIRGVQLNFDFDKSLVDVDNTENGDFFDFLFQDGTIKNDQGSVEDIVGFFFVSGDSKSDDGIFVSLTLTANAEGTLSLSLSNVIVTNPSNDEYNNVNALDITVGIIIGGGTYCGDGTVQQPNDAGTGGPDDAGYEDCDSNDLNGETCVSQGFDAGTLGCTDSCTFDTSECTGAETLQIESVIPKFFSTSYNDECGYGYGIAINWEQTDLGNADHYRVEFKEEDEDWNLLADRSLDYPDLGIEDASWINDHGTIRIGKNYENNNFNYDYCRNLLWGKKYYYRVRVEDADDNALTGWSEVSEDTSDTVFDYNQLTVSLSLDTEISETNGDVVATLSNNDAEECKISWDNGDTWQSISKSLASKQKIYSADTTVKVKYRCRNQDNFWKVISRSINVNINECTKAGGYCASSCEGEGIGINMGLTEACPGVSRDDESVETEEVEKISGAPSQQYCCMPDAVTNCDNDIDDDNDGIIDALDTDCALGGEAFIEQIASSDDEPFEDSEIGLTCRFDVNLEVSSLEEGESCIKAKVADTECSFEERTENFKDFKCDAGSLEENKEVICYIDENCHIPLGGSRDLKTYLNVTKPVECPGDSSDDLIGILDVELNDDYFVFGDILELDLDVKNIQSDEVKIVTELDLYNLNTKEKLASDSQTKIVPGGLKKEAFNLALTVPEVGEGKFRLYLKVYEDDNEDEVCGVISLNLEIEETEFEEPEEFDIDFTTSTESSISGLEGEITTFTLDGETEHSVEFDQITEDSVTLKIRSSIKTRTLGIGESTEIDLDDDGINDIEITLTSIEDGVADIIVKKIEEIGEICTTGEVQECGNNIGICQKGSRSCKEDGTWGPCVWGVPPSTEICSDTFDNDCDGLTDCSDLPDCRTAPNCVTAEEEDSDNDGMDDSWELSYFGSLDQTANGDFDGDGFTNLEELNRGTDPTSADVLEKKFPWTTVLIVLVILIIIGVIIYFFVSMSKKPKVRLKPEGFKPSARKPSKSVSPALTDYIKTSLKKGYSKQQIKTALKAKGWSDKEIDEAFK